MTNQLLVVQRGPHTQHQYYWAHYLSPLPMLYMCVYKWMNGYKFAPTRHDIAALPSKFLCFFYFFYCIFICNIFLYSYPQWFLEISKARITWKFIETNWQYKLNKWKFNFLFKLIYLIPRNLFYCVNKNRLTMPNLWQTNR